MRALVRLARLQGVYFVATGVWPLVHLASFEAISGPKTDDWLVRTVGVLVLAIGLVLLVGALRLRVPFELALLAMASALGLAAMDVVYVTTDVIWDVYLLDALVEGALVLLWGWAFWRSRDDPRVWGRSLGERAYKNTLEEERVPGRLTSRKGRA